MNWLYDFLGDIKELEIEKGEKYFIVSNQVYDISFWENQMPEDETSEFRYKGVRRQMS